MMDWKCVSLLLMTITVTACITEKVEVVTDPTSIKVDNQSELANSQYSTKQAVLDAEAAVKNQDFALLAFTNKTITFPGIDNNLYPLEVLENQCGITYLSGSGDTLKIGESTERRKALKKYALTYNLIVLKGCQSFHKNNQK